MKVIKFNGKQDYSKLNHLPFNRRFTVRTDLVQSMNDFGFIDPIKLIETDIITGKKELFVADGQHRAITAAFLNIKFYGIIIDVVFTTKESLVEFVANLNSTHKVWTISNYVDSYAYLQKEPYKTLLSYKEKSPYSLYALATMLYGYRSKNSVTKKIEDGTFVINNEEGTKYTLSLAAKYSKHEPLTNRMLLALNYVCSLTSFNEPKFEAIYKEKAKQIKELKLDDYTDVFSSWIN